MRAIKFRAWDKQYKRICEVISIEWFQDKLYEVYIQTKYGQERIVPEMVDLIQFIGLHDKNGKEIYEGDIVRCGDGGECFPQEYNEEEDEYYDCYVYEVYWGGNEQYPAFDLRDNPNEETNGLSYLMANGTIEVIGNIYENPELLK